MTDHREESAQKNDRLPIPQENAPWSSPKCKCEHSKESAESSALDNLMKLNEAFYRKESRLLTRFAARIGVPSSDVEDVVGEGWLKVLEHRDAFEGQAMEWRVHCLMEKVIHDKAVDLHRHLNSYPYQSLSEQGIEPSDDMATKRVETTELHEWLEALMAEASQGNDENLSLLRAHFFYGISIPELAQQLGMTAKSVEGRIRRLVEKMREIVEKTFGSKF